MHLANTAAPPVQPNPSPGSEQRPPVLYVEPDAPSPITNPILLPIALQGGAEPTPRPFRASGVADPSIGQGAARRAVAFFQRSAEGWRLRGGDVANGMHAVIARQASGMPAGEQSIWPIQQRSTLFRPPDPWDRGAVRATPGAANATS